MNPHAPEEQTGYDDVSIAQPVLFDHRHHVLDDGWIYVLRRGRWGVGG